MDPMANYGFDNNEKSWWQGWSARVGKTHAGEGAGSERRLRRWRFVIALGIVGILGPVFCKCFLQTFEVLDPLQLGFSEASVRNMSELLPCGVAQKGLLPMLLWMKAPC